MLRGVRRRTQREREERLTLAYDTAGMTAAAAVGKLDKLEVYLSRVRPRARQTPGQMLQVLRDLASSGAPITITSTKNSAEGD